MDKRKNQKLGSFMCKILRHEPEGFGVTIDEYGYCSIDSLVNSIKNSEPFWNDVTKEVVLDSVKNDPKNRYELKEDKIRATYGHSIPVIQDYKERDLPEILFHGTNENALHSILNNKEGIKHMSRQYVHLSESTGFAELAAKRRKNPVLVTVDTSMALKAGVTFIYAGNEVWLSTDIPANCISLHK